MSRRRLVSGRLAPRHRVVLYRLLPVINVQQTYVILGGVADVETKLGSLRARSVGLALCAPIDSRLDQLWTIARMAGQPTSRQEIVAALILDAKPDPGRLGRLLNRYRDTRVAEVLVPGVPGSLIDAPKRPGRRRLREGTE